MKYYFISFWSYLVRCITASRDTTDQTRGCSAHFAGPFTHESIPTIFPSQPMKQETTRRPLIRKVITSKNTENDMTELDENENITIGLPMVWFFPGTSASSITKTGRHHIAEILLKVALNTKNQIKSNPTVTEWTLISALIRKVITSKNTENDMTELDENENITIANNNMKKVTSTSVEGDNVLPSFESISKNKFKTSFTQTEVTTHTNNTSTCTTFVSYKKGAIDSQPQLIKFTSCLPMVWFFPGTSASSITKTGRHHIAEITIKQPMQ
jgi:hypothetical protein